jgi:hypothetical protein
MNALKAIGVCGLGLILSSLPCNAVTLQTPQQDEAAAKASVAALSDAERAQLKAFSDRVKAYVSMQKKLPSDRLSPTKDVAQLEQQRKALRDALQHERQNAKQGDMFTPELAPVLRKLLRSTMTGPEGPQIRASLNHAEPNAPRDLTVNGAYPNLDGQPLQSMPPTLLLNLPVLPKGLEYRITGHTLSLRDANANMVVDYLPDALP